MKICFASSSGGHFEQMMMLKPLMEKYDSFLLTEKTQYGVQVEGVRVYTVPQVNRREHTFAFTMIGTFFRSFCIFWKERPDVVISTGVLATIPMCLIAKLFGRKLIYLESFAKITSATETGKLLYRFADQFYVQWPGMMNIYPKAIYKGCIY